MTEDELCEAVHPGDVLREFLTDYGITPYKLAKDVGLARPTINDLANGKGRVSPRTASALGRYFRTTTAYWLNLQMHYDLRTLAEDDDLTLWLAEIKPVVDVVAPE